MANTARPVMTRRRFLLGSGALAVVAGTGLAAPYMVDRMRGHYRPWLDRATGTGRLADQQLATILALIEVLIPSDFSPDPARSRQLINTATDNTPGLLVEYAEASRYLDLVADRREGAPFAAIDRKHRHAILSDMLWEYPAGPRGNRRNYLTTRLELISLNAQERRIRQLVVRDLLERFFLEAQVHLIGYSNTPGVAGNPRDYVTAPSSASS